MACFDRALNEMDDLEEELLSVFNMSDEVKRPILIKLEMMV